MINYISKVKPQGVITKISHPLVINNSEIYIDFYMCGYMVEGWIHFERKNIVKAGAKLKRPMLFEHIFINKNIKSYTTIPLYIYFKI
jgi:hypothetical protein